MGWLLRQGVSWSGHERDVAYLGLGDGSFVEAAGALGIDFDADGRCVARVDWDGDGDLDVWMRARSEPRVRFLENRVPRRGTFVRAKLVDALHAIGARLEVRPADQPQATPWLRTRRAGEGYLSQSSEWLHVGVGAVEQVDLTVVWADGTREAFGTTPSGRALVLRRGEGRWREGPSAYPWGEAPAEPSPDARERGIEGRVVLATPHPLPTLPVQRADGQTLSLGGLAAYQRGRQQKPALLMVWSRDCAPCAQELAAWSRARDAVRETGLGVLALEVPGETEDQPDWLERVQWPFAQARLTEESTELMHALSDYFTDHTGPLAVPLSWLVDERGRLQVLYLGPADPEVVLRDMGLFGLQGPQRLRQAFPFDGVFLEPPKEPRWVRWGQFLRARGLERSAEELQWAQVSAERLDGADAQFRVGEARLRQGRPQEALPSLQAAVDLAPSVPRYQGALARCLMALEQPQEARKAWQSALIGDPRRAEYLLGLGTAACALGDRGEALRAWQTLRPLDQAAAAALKERIDGMSEPAPTTPADPANEPR